jgi:hypothetical protein
VLVVLLVEAVPVLSRRLLRQTVAVCRAAEMARAGRLLRQAVAVCRAAEMAWAGRLLRQAMSDRAALLEPALVPMRAGRRGTGLWCETMNED